MILGDLPYPIKELAYVRAITRPIDKDLKVDDNLDLTLAFNWSESPEGGDFWRDVYLGNFQDPPTDVVSKPKIIVKLKNDLWNKVR